MIRNVVLVKLKAEADAAEVAEIQDGFRNLDCPGTVSYTLGDDLGLRDGTWNFAIVADFTDVASYRAYDLDAAHNRYRARLGPLAEQIARVQFELPGGLPADEPAGMAAAPASGLANPAEAVGLEELDGAHVTAGLVDAPACSTAPSSSWCISPRRRNPGRTTKQTTDHAPSSWTCGIVRELTRAR